jgi:phenylacetate-CoA ligase
LHEQDPIETRFFTQQKRLGEFLTTAVQESPYYQEQFQKLGISMDRDFPIERFRELPFLTKGLIRENFEKLKNKNIASRSWFYNRTGGSTGEPLLFIQDQAFLDFSLAVKQLQFQWAGKADGDHRIKLWGSQDDILKGGIGWKAKFSNWLHDITLLNSFAMTPADMQEYVNIIRKKTPAFIEAYADSAYELAAYINRYSEPVSGIKSVVASAGPLYPFMRNVIESAFSCKVYNRYGSREMGDMACEKEPEKGLHVSTYTHLIEVVNEAGSPCKPGEEGDIVATCLTNVAFPFIRYKIGDRGMVQDVMSDGIHSCTILANVTGRGLDSIVRRDGTVISGVFFLHILGVVFNSGWLKQMQIIQLDYEDIEIDLVVFSKPALAELQIIETAIQKAMGANCKVSFKFVENISKLPSGKYQYTKSLVGNADHLSMTGRG